MEQRGVFDVHGESRFYFLERTVVFAPVTPDVTGASRLRSFLGIDLQQHLNHLLCRSDEIEHAPELLAIRPGAGPCSPAGLPFEDEKSGIPRLLAASERALRAPEQFGRFFRPRHVVMEHDAAAVAEPSKPTSILARVAFFTFYHH